MASLYRIRKKTPFFSKHISQTIMGWYILLVKNSNLESNMEFCYKKYEKNTKKIRKIYEKKVVKCRKNIILIN